jgi:hypothetical protein
LPDVSVAAPKGWSISPAYSTFATPILQTSPLSGTHTSKPVKVLLPMTSLPHARRKLPEESNFWMRLLSSSAT